jgi:CHAT domain-containing protein/Tfp pilus assembly protein PilF
LNNIAWVHHQLADPQIALDFYQQALAIVRKIDDRHLTAVALNNIGEIYADLGDYRKAASLHQEALPLRRAEGDTDGEANSLNNLGKAYANLGERTKARDFFEQALQKLRPNGNRYMLARTLRNLGELESESSALEESLALSRAIHDPYGEAAALADLARLERDRGNLVEARGRADEAMAALESVRLAVTSPKLRASYFASARDLQELNIEVLMRLHSDAAALLAAERGRARSLLEMLGEGASEIRRGVDESLLARERQIQQLIAAKAARQAESKEVTTLAAELDQVQSRIRSTSPHYAALTQPSPLNLEQIQTQVLDPETVLLEYALGSRKSYLFVVTDSSLKCFELPARSEIESAAKRVYAVLTTRPRNAAEESASLKKAGSILLSPISAKIAGKRLLIIAEGVLQYLPFAALPDPSDPAVPLIANHEIVTAPSASVVAVLRNETAGRPPAPKTVAIFADPAFGAQFLPLRFSRSEADEIARLAPPESTLKVVGVDATREAAMRPEIGQYRILHFATHSVLDNQHPELSGVVLSLTDRAGRPQNGFLRLYDIYNLRLGADLVVLSACQTALGGEVKGEGLIGLTRGFFYAGAPRVVDTLWQVDDRTTSELMKHFYAGVLTRGERPAAALRAAQLAMWRTKGWDAPYYWGAFTISGEWR